MSRPRILRLAAILMLVGSQAQAQRPGDLGWLSERYESGGLGPGTVSSGSGDKGGPSYGTYRLSSESRPGRASSVEQFVARYYPEQFAGMKVNSPEFRGRWAELARNRADFADNQRRFIGETHYDPVVRMLQDEVGLDPTT